MMFSAVQPTVALAAGCGETGAATWPWNTWTGEAPTFCANTGDICSGPCGAIDNVTLTLATEPTNGVSA